jgi:hypothetical protein
MTSAARLALLVLSLAALACVVYEPTPTPVYTNYDRAWDSALRAAQDAGINLTSVDRAGGITLGSKDGIDATITVRR